ncbi:hypothetical protein T10_7580 [Trichinella papuae]|uniref:Uncharacterized protein n=1 Tax=Trichinella papuae TaxID=268474 RepID=A0A0V1M1U8_9BILA|nr:hypothetical protein T10_7580 [Trichinella papuae]
MKRRLVSYVLNHLVGEYAPPHIIGRKFSELLETLMSDDIFSSKEKIEHSHFLPPGRITAWYGCWSNTRWFFFITVGSNPSSGFFGLISMSLSSLQESVAAGSANITLTV